MYNLCSSLQILKVWLWNLKARHAHIQQMMRSSPSFVTKPQMANHFKQHPE